jgi:hypothetical protein
MGGPELAAELQVLLGKFSPVQLVLVGAAVLFAAAVLGRLIFNGLPSKRPPVFEGIPFIGGLLKFIGVSACRARPSDHDDWLLADCPRGPGPNPPARR